MFYNIPCVMNQVAFRQFTYVGKIPGKKESHVMTRPLTAWCANPRKRGGQLVMNKDSLVKNLRLVLSDVNDAGSMSTWGFHTLYAKYWFLLISILKHLYNQTPDNPPDGQEADGDETRSDPPPPLPHSSSYSSTTSKLANRYKISPSSNVKK